MSREDARSREIPDEIEEVLNEAADNIDGTIDLLLDIRGSHASDARLHAAIAALRHTRAIMDPALDSM